MKRLLLALLLLAGLTLPAPAADKANTVLLHMGDVVYARFETHGKKIKLVSATKEKDETAQIIFTFQPDAKNGGSMLKVENKFDRDFLYKVEMRSLTLKKHFSSPTSPVVAKKLSFETFPKVVEELACTDFKLEK